MRIIYDDDIISVIMKRTGYKASRNVSSLILQLNSTHSFSHAHDCSIKFAEAELPIILFVSTISNFVALITLTRLYCKLRSKNLHLLIIMAANDLCSSLSILVNNITNTLTCDSFSHYVLCDLLGWVGITSFGWSMFLVASISLERYLMVLHPFYHHTKVTRLKLSVIVFFGALVDLLFLGIPLTGFGGPYIYYHDNRFCGFNWAAAMEGVPVHTFFVVFLAAYGLGQVAVTVFCNVSSTLYIRGKGRQIMPVNQQHLHPLRRQADRFALLTMVIAAVNSICSLPFFIKLLIDAVNQKKEIEGVEDSITTILLFCTPVINPLLYLIFNKSYRQLLFQPCYRHCQPCQKTQVNPSVAMVTQRQSKQDNNPDNIHVDGNEIVQ